MSKTSPTQRSLKLARTDGYTCAITEHYNAFIGIRQDLFGFIDIVAIKPGEMGILAIQTTSTGNITSRVKKILDLPVHKLWLGAGNRIEVWGWAKRGLRGKVKRWEVKKVVLE